MFHWESALNKYGAELRDYFFVNRDETHLFLPVEYCELKGLFSIRSWKSVRFCYIFILWDEQHPIFLFFLEEILFCSHSRVVLVRNGSCVEGNVLCSVREDGEWENLRGERVKLAVYERYLLCTLLLVIGNVKLIPFIHPFCRFTVYANNFFWQCRYCKCFQC